MGQGMQIYASENTDRFPGHYFEAETSDEAVAAGRHGVAWIGMMGSHESLKISEPTSPTRSPRASHPSRSLFVLMISADATPGLFTCPSSGEAEDRLRNYGPDGRDAGDSTAMPGTDRFDFNGYSSLSYGYLLPFGASATSRRMLDAGAPVAADKGPFFDAGGEGLAGTRTVVDKLSAATIPPQWKRFDAQRIRALAIGEWKRLNSRNHEGEGQSVLYADGHADFARTPLVGIGGDNIYTLGGPNEADGSPLGLTPAEAPLLGPRTQSDSYIVP